MNAKILAVIVILVFIVSAVGIISLGDNEAAAEGDFTIVDDRGVEFTFNSSFTRIASLGKPFTQILYELGAGDKIVSVDTYSLDLKGTYPDIDNKTYVGGSIFGLDVEEVIKTNPDVIITYDYTSDSVKTRIAGMEEFFPVLAFYPKSYNDVITLIQKIGMISGETVKAVELADQMKEVRNEIALTVAGVPQPKVYFELSTYDERTANIGSVSHSLIVMAGGINVAQDVTMGTSYPTVPDTVMSWNPDIIIVEDRHSKTNLEVLDVYKYPERDDPLVYRFTTGYNTYDLNLMRGLMEMAEYLHPDLFDFT